MSFPGLTSSLLLGGSGVTMFSYGVANASYENKGGQGDRTSGTNAITVSTSIPISGSVQDLVNGAYFNTFFFNNTGSNVGHWVKFDFGVGKSKVITEAKFYQLNNLHDWKWQGSNDNSTWTDIGGTFTINGNTTITTLSGNTTGYRYYRMIGVSGNLADNYCYEMKFKIVDLTIAARPASTLWTPDEIGTALWLDADDASTITQSGGLVSQWNDKSGYARHASQATSGSRPTYSATGWVEDSAKPYIRSLSKSMTLASSVQYNSEISIFFCGKANASSSSILSGGGINQLQMRFSRAVNFVKQQAVEYGGSTPLMTDLTGNVCGGVATSGLTATVGQTIWVNGTSTVINSVDPNFANGFFVLFAANSGEFFQSDVTEFVVIHGGATTATRQKIEGYLANKWNTKARLVSGHPYASRAPTIAD